ncbi:ParB N-terminal domain-containing protein, partial [Mesorhizobium sp. M1E.F.Ca.ET.041.01.1.1]|uniref:ParB/RepB/Spo0J family partition protein n=1 Tax=Mesorhizobium sp. M1E.F.Ca.ET.041.01.1.1 TaxID=2496759 RepID=UPI000FD27F6A
MNTIPIEQIGFEMRLRKISQAQVERLAGSIADVGILHPITVYRRQIISDGRPIDGYGLVAGAHRVEACKRLGLAEIPAHVVELSDLERQIAECDENLCGPALTQSEKALFIRRRKDAYEALHPETRREATLKQGTELPSRQVGETGKIDRFTTDTAAKTGQSERAVQRAAERGAKISDKALVAVRGTKLDKGAYLDKLKTVPEPDQVAKVKADLASSRPPAKSETVEAVTRTAKRESTLRQRFADAI